MVKHNKKRNVGIIYEQIISFMCEKSIDNDQQAVSEAFKIIKNHFKEGTQLNKEYKLFNALATTNNINPTLASSILQESKKASNYHFDNEVLQKEKSDLIRELNYSFGKGEIFKQNVKNYKTYATIQVLLNEWRKEDKDIKILADFESKLHESLCCKKQKEETQVKNISIKDPLVRKLMKENFNKKYKNILSLEQSRLISEYFSTPEGKKAEMFKDVKNLCLETLKNYRNMCDNKILIENFDIVYEKIYEFDYTDISENSLKKALMMQKLVEEIECKDEK